MFELIRNIVSPFMGKTPPEIALLDPVDNMQVASGTIINLTNAAKAAGLDGEVIRQQQQDRFQRGVSSYVVEFFEPFELPYGFKTKMAEIPRDFGDASLSKLAEANVGKKVAIAMTTGADRKSRVIAMDLE